MVAIIHIKKFMRAQYNKLFSVTLKLNKFTSLVFWKKKEANDNNNNCVGNEIKKTNCFEDLRGYKKRGTLSRLNRAERDEQREREN